ncbi:hypothetical protein [Algihabitans albus]|nr:hypothetical protein [Algihabitans albus]
MTAALKPAKPSLRNGYGAVVMPAGRPCDNLTEPIQPSHALSLR